MVYKKQMFGAGIVAATLAPAMMFSFCWKSAAQETPPGRVVGHIDGIASTPGGWHIKGWACQQGRRESIDVHLFAGEADSVSKTTLAYAGKANLEEEPAVDVACQDIVGRKHRFDIPLPGSLLVRFHGMRLFVHGIRVAGNVENAAMAGSGLVRFPDAPAIRRAPPSGGYPRVSGHYVSLGAHPRVFDTREQLQDIARRASIPGTYSAGRYAALADRVKGDIAAKVDWQATYSGCDVEIYLRGFSYEQKPAYGNDRSDDELRAAMHGQPGLAPPHGAAIVAARAALYAALVKAGARPLPGAPSADDAAALAKRILLAWADHGFRNDGGVFRLTDAEYCDLDPNGKPHVTQFGTFVGALTLSRGVIYSVHAQDLLEGIDALTSDEQTRLDGFHHNMFEVIRAIHNQECDVNRKWQYSDEMYNNQFVGHLTALLSIARLFDDGLGFDAVLNGGGGGGGSARGGGDGSSTVKLPWIELFDHVIYGVNDVPHLNVTPNTSVDPLKSRPAYSTTTVAPGEINDRFRNDNPLQGFGYSMGSLAGLYMAAEIMRPAGLNAYAYEGAHGQSLEMATDFVACFAKGAGFAKVVTADNSRNCPNAEEYYGKLVNGAEVNVLIGGYRFPGDEAITALDKSAKDSFASSSSSIEPILFGKWRD